MLPDILYRPWTLDAEHVEVRPLRDEIPSVDVGLVWRRGAGQPGFFTAIADLIRQTRANV